MPNSIEPERYELFEPPAYQFVLTRREVVGLLGAGLLISVAPVALGQRPKAESRLHLGDDGTVTVFAGKVEFGQGARTELAMAAAEELRLPLDRVRVTLADTDLTPNDGITAGSRTTPSTVPAVRSAAAAARQLLTATARRTWGVERVEVRDGAASADGKSMSYADLAKTPKDQLPATGAVTESKDWRVLGTSRHRVDAVAVVNGSHRYPSDIQLPGMLYGAVLRAPSYGAKLISADGKAAGGAVIVQDGAFVGCAAETSFAARKALAAIEASAQWQRQDHPSSMELFAHLKAKVRAGSRPRTQSKGSLEDGLRAAKQTIRGTYQVPYIQHAPMEPRAAVAEWNDGKLTVWTGTQNPFGVRDQLMQAFHLGAEKVRVIVPDSGGGFGGKHTGEVAIEAARLAREAGKPVSLRWTRAEEFMWAYFRPAGLFEIEAGVDADGRLTAWDYTNYNAGTASMESPYRVANARTRFIASDSPLREGSYRGIAATANNFARECFMDELAAAASMEPLAFRLANLEDGRLKDVLLAATKKFGWAKRKASGLACGTEKGSYVAACAEVAVEGGQVRLREICMAFECGAILNPVNLRAQVEGAIIQGLGGALSEEIEFEGGRLKNGSFAKYRVPRFRDLPKIEIVLVNRPDLASAGAGETPIIGVAPAIANAVFAVTGKRARKMPVRA